MPHTNDLNLLKNDGWDERILICQNGRLVSTFIIVSDRYVVLVDTIINPATAQKMMDFAQPYLKNGRQLLVVNTHADYDHCWGNQLFVGETARYPAPIIGHRLSPDLFKHPDALGYLAKMKEAEPDIFGDVIFTPPTILFDDKLTIDGGDLTVELFFNPGHTTDHCALYLPEIDTLIAADGAELPYPAARTNSALPRMRQSLREMADLEAKTVLYCHAPATMGAQLLHDNIAYFDQLEEACRVAVEKGVGVEHPAGTDLSALINLTFEQATPDNEQWQAVHPYYRREGHWQQIQAMLEYVVRET